MQKAVWGGGDGNPTGGGVFVRGGTTPEGRLSTMWDGELAEFRGHVQWGVEGQAAARACLRG